jgi:hypothetical protein
MTVSTIFRRTSMRHLLADTGLLPGQLHYTRFLVVGRSRTGSNLLRSLLSAHPQVEAYGEVFRSPSRQGPGGQLAACVALPGAANGHPSDPHEATEHA